MPDLHQKAEFTGERVIPGQVDDDLLNEHLSRYAFARRFATGRRVLDLGCGAGYGSALLAEVAEHVTGSDASAEAVEYAREHYSRPNLQFEVGDAAAPRDFRFGLITAFEVIEHLEDWRGMLRMVRQALAEKGLFLVSTPNKPLYAEARGESGANPFHVHEFEYQEFCDALEGVFPYVQMFVQNHSAGVLFSPILGGPNASGRVGESAIDVDQANYFVALCSPDPFPHADHYFWISRSANLLRERERHIALLENVNRMKTEWEQKTREELRERNREFEDVLALYRSLQNDLESRNRWAAEQDELLRQRGERIIALQLEAETANADFSQVAADYEEQLAAIRQAVDRGREAERRLEDELEQRGAMLAECVELLHAAERTIEERTRWAQNLDREMAEWRQRFEAARQLRWIRMGTRLHLMPHLG